MPNFGDFTDRYFEKKHLVDFHDFSEIKIQSINSCSNAPVREVSNEISQHYGVEVDFEVCDVSDRKSLMDMKNTLKAKSWFSEIGILVNNAGILPIPYESISEVAEDEFQRLFRF